jgi:hypothetical protein
VDDAADDAPIINPRHAACIVGQQRRQPRPLPIIEKEWL